MLNYSSSQIVLQEVPGEISLALSISGCNLQCKGCHSKDTWNNKFGKPLTLEELSGLIIKNKYLTCVLFYGGEWDIEYLLKLVSLVRSYNLNVALYTGRDLSFFENDFINALDFIKVGKYNEKLGGLNDKTTNQKMYKITNGELELLKFV